MNILNAALVLLIFTTPVQPIPKNILKKFADMTPFDCVRPIPKPIVKKSVFPSSKFVLNFFDDHGQAIPKGTETVLFKNGDQLKITNSGCEFVTLNFTFQTNQVSEKTKDNKYLYNRSAVLMRNILRGIDSPINLRRGIVALENYASVNSDPQMDTEIDYGNPEIRSVVKLVNVKQLPNKKSVVEILFYYGPL
jgi:hypothetical protein